VRFDVKFTGGHQCRWLKSRYGDRCCAIATEFKKVYIDEWTGEPDEPLTEVIGDLMELAAVGVRDALPTAPYAGAGRGRLES